MPGFVTVACKLPHGLTLRVFDMKAQDEPVMGGGMRKSSVAVERDERVTLNGFSHPQNAAPKCTVVDGFALTPNVPAEFFAEWMKQNAKSDVVRNRLIYAHEQEESAVDYAKEHAELLSGMERLNPNKLPGGKIQTADDIRKDLAKLKSVA